MVFAVSEPRNNENEQSMVFENHSVPLRLNDGINFLHVINACKQQLECSLTMVSVIWLLFPQGAETLCNHLAILRSAEPIRGLTQALNIMLSSLKVFSSKIASGKLVLSQLTEF